MRKLYFDQLFTGKRWFCEGLTLELDDCGTIISLMAGDKPKDATAINDIAIPGMPNLHSHAHQRTMVGLAEHASGGNNFWSWRDVMYRHLSGMQPHHLYAIANQLYMEMLKAGYTAVAEFQYLHHDLAGVPYQNKAQMSLQCLAAAQHTGIGITCLPVLYTYGDVQQQPISPNQARFYNRLEDFLNIYEICAKGCHDNPNTAVGIAPHSLRAVDLVDLTELVQSIPEVPIHIHIAEQRTEVDKWMVCSGKRPVQWLLENMDINSRWSLIHATHIDTNEIVSLATSEAVVGLCPSTEANLGDGIFPGRNFLDHGGHFGIGSDSQVSVNPIEEIRWFEYVQRLQHERRNVLADTHCGASLYRQALAGGAQACGRQIGYLEPGYRADILVLDGQHPRLVGRHKDYLLDSWIFSGHGCCIKHVFVGGKQWVQDGHHLDEEIIGQNYRDTIAQLL